MTQIIINSARWLPYPLITVLFSLVLTRICISVLPRFGFVDIPHGRHMHEHPVPRGGGIAIVLSFFLGIVLMSLLAQENPVFMEENKAAFDGLKVFSWPALFLFLVGLADDRFELRSLIKLFVHIAIGCYFFFRGYGIDSVMDYHLPWYLGLSVTVCWVIGIINAFNLIDGLDGISAGLGAIASFSLAVWSLISGGSTVSIIIQLIFCASCLGFLRYNFHPAKIFMGDTGSTFIGLFFAFESMSEATKAITATSLLVPLMAIGIPIFDVFLAIWRRFFRRYIKHDKNAGIMDGDHDHLHHRILKMEGSQEKTAVVIYLLAFLLSVCAMMSVFLEKNLPALVFTVFFISIFCIIRYANIEILDTLTCVADGFHIPHRNAILTAIHPAIDMLILSCAFLVTAFLLPSVLKKPFSLISYLCFVCPFVFCFCISGIYRTFWLRAGISQYYKFFRISLISGVIGFSGVYLLSTFRYGYQPLQIRGIAVFYLVFFLLSNGLFALERFLLRYLESFGFARMYVKNRSMEKGVHRVVIYGGGMLCRLYILRCYGSFSPYQSDPVDIVGILDDNPALQRLNVYGFDVLGGSTDLERIIDHVPFEEIVITLKDLPPDAMGRLESFARSHGIALTSFGFEETRLVEPVKKNEPETPSQP